MANLERFENGVLSFPTGLETQEHCVVYRPLSFDGLQIGDRSLDTYLQLPIEFPSDSISMGWSNEGDAIKAGNIDISNVKDINSLMESAGSLSKGIMQRGKRAGQEMVAKVGSSTTGQDAGDLVKAFDRSKGRSVNTFQEQFFDGPEFRTFELSHELVARSREDTETIRNIVTRFRYYSSPSLVDDQMKNAYWQYPSQWQIRFKSMEGGRLVGNKFISKYHNSVLTSVGVDYGGESFATFANNAPVNVKISLNFTETVLIKKEDIKKAHGIS